MLTPNKENKSSRDVGATRLTKHILAPQGSASVDTGAAVDVVLVDSTSLVTVVSAVSGPMNDENKSKLLIAAVNFEDDDLEIE